MNPEIEIFQGGTMNPVERVPLMAVLKPAVERLTGLSLEGKVILLQLWAEEEEQREVQGIYNMMPAYGYATVNVLDRESRQCVYRHPHPLSELMCRQLREMLDQRAPGQPRWGFVISAPQLSEAQIIIPPPPVAGAFAPASGSLERPKLRISALPEPPLPRISLAEFSIAAAREEDKAAAVKVLVRETVFEDLKSTRAFSEQIEEGGFLVGRVYEDAECPGTHLVEITGAPKAEHTGASLLHLTFTGDSFTEIKRRLRGDLAQDRLLGWYHTHLFPASVPMGLSSIDVDLHSTTFRQPWQVAGLVNLDGNGRRTLRFYVRSGLLMRLCPQWRLHDLVVAVASPS